MWPPKSPDRRPDGDAHVAAHAQQRIAVGTLLFGQQVRQHGVAADAVERLGDAVYGHQERKGAQSAGVAQHQVGKPVQEQAEDHDPFAPQAVDDRPGEEGGHQPGRRVERHQAGCHRQRHFQVLGQVDHQEGPDHAAADRADQHAEEHQAELARVVCEECAHKGQLYCWISRNYPL